MPSLNTKVAFPRYLIYWLFRTMRNRHSPFISHQDDGVVFCCRNLNGLRYKHTSWLAKWIKSSQMPRVQNSSWLSSLNPVEQALLILLKSLLDSISLCCEIDTRQAHFLLLFTCYRDTTQRLVYPTSFTRVPARVFSFTSQHYQLYRARRFSTTYWEQIKKKEKEGGQVWTWDSFMLFSAQLCRRMDSYTCPVGLQGNLKWLHGAIKPE